MELVMEENHKARQEQQNFVPQPLQAQQAPRSDAIPAPRATSFVDEANKRSEVLEVVTRQLRVEPILEPSTAKADDKFVDEVAEARNKMEKFCRARGVSRALGAEHLGSLLSGSKSPDFCDLAHVKHIDFVIGPEKILSCCLLVFQSLTVKTFAAENETQLSSDAFVASVDVFLDFVPCLAK